MLSRAAANHVRIGTGGGQLHESSHCRQVLAQLDPRRRSRYFRAVYIRAAGVRLRRQPSVL